MSELKNLRAALCHADVVAQVAGYAVVRREDVLSIVDAVIAAQLAAPAAPAVEDIARFVSEEWQQPDIAAGIRLQFAAAQPVQEPIAWMVEVPSAVEGWHSRSVVFDEPPFDGAATVTRLYAAPVAQPVQAERAPEATIAQAKVLLLKWVAGDLGDSGYMTAMRRLLDAA